MPDSGVYLAIWILMFATVGFALASLAVMIVLIWPDK